MSGMRHSTTHQALGWPFGNPALVSARMPFIPPRPAHILFQLQFKGHHIHQKPVFFSIDLRLSHLSSALLLLLVSMGSHHLDGSVSRIWTSPPMRPSVSTDYAMESTKPINDKTRWVQSTHGIWVNLDLSRQIRRPDKSPYHLLPTSRSCRNPSPHHHTPSLLDCPTRRTHPRLNQKCPWLPQE
jgi:hypothetical protein